MQKHPSRCRTCDEDGTFKAKAEPSWRFWGLYTTGALTNPTVFGRLTGNTLSARRIQFGARLTF